ncbi:hypothetical protein V7S79_02235 [Aquirufa sp. ROCK-SH2]
MSKNAIGIILLFVGPPLFYFLRAQFHLGGGSITSGIFYLISLYLIRNPLNSQLGFKPNKILLQTGGTFFLFTLIYFAIYNQEPQNKLLDTLNISIIILFFFSIIRVDNQIQKFLPFWLIVITLLINVLLLYSVINNPNYTIGLRASVQFGDKDFTGNPGIYARNGLIGIIISLLYLLKQEKNLFLQDSIKAYILTLLNVIFSIITIIITQTRMILLSLLIILFVFVFYVNKRKIESFKSNFNKKYIYLGLTIITFYINIKYAVFEILSYYIDSYWVIFERAIVTSLTFGKSSNVEIDASAMGRVENINYFFKIIDFEKFNLIFGKGWRYKYIDIPILETLINFGVIGLILFLLFIISLIVLSIESLKSKSVFQNFLSLFLLNAVIGIFSSGRPMDLGYWLVFVLYIRFLSVKYESDSKSIES